MGEKIIITIVVLLFIFFLLSVAAPEHSEKKFWITIHKFRARLDFVVYWFFNLCAILSILYLVLMTVRGLF